MACLLRVDGDFEESQPQAPQTRKSPPGEGLDTGILEQVDEAAKPVLERLLVGLPLRKHDMRGGMGDRRPVDIQPADIAQVVVGIRKMKSEKFSIVGWLPWRSSKSSEVGRSRKTLPHRARR